MFSICAHHSDFIVAYKPEGVDVHTCEGTAGFFVQLENQLGEKLYPVHRLDKVTSGLIVVGRSSESASVLAAAFRRREVQKFYLAIADKKPKKKQGAVVGDMERSRRGTWKLTPATDNPAITQFFSYALADGLRLFLLKPATGKTHQLRVATKSLGSPILGDALYGGTASDRVYLHAYGLGFCYAGIAYTYLQPPLAGQAFTNALVSSTVNAIGDPAALPWPVKVKQH